MRKYLLGNAILVIGLMTVLTGWGANAVASEKMQGRASDPSIQGGPGYQGIVFERRPDGSIGSKIAGVNITFVSENGQVRRSVITDNNGVYRIGLGMGRYHVTARHADYEDYSSAPGFFVVSGAGYQTGNIFLKKKMVTTVLLVRHADRGTTPPNDPSLTPAGQARANELVHVAGKAVVKAIFATNALRSQQTVQPLATHLNLPIITYGYNDFTGLRNRVLSGYSGQVVLVAGHSDTLQGIISAFGGDWNRCRLSGDEYDNLCVITTWDTGKVNVINLQYGAASP